MRRHVHGGDFYLGIMYQVMIAIPRNAFRYLAKGRISFFYAYMKAVGWHLKNIANPHIHDNPFL